MTTVSPRRIRSTLTALVTGGLALLVAAGSPALGEALRRPLVDPATAVRLQALDRWQGVVATFESAGTGPDQLFVAADAASAVAHEVQVAGWRSPAIPHLVSALLATANPDGGYGLAKEWDAYQDGTVNPATTSYTATTAGHVGPVLLAGYLAGMVDQSAVTRVIDWILSLPEPKGGTCIPYSASPDDLEAACVWNVHFGAAAWVKRASAATGHRPDDAAALAARAVSVLGTVAPDPATGYLPYSSAQTRPQDIGHQLWTAASIDSLRGNRDALNAMVSKPLWRVQARRFRDYNVASAMSGIALFDCRFASDRTVLRYAGSTARGNPYVFRALAAQARLVTQQCFPDPAIAGRVAVRSTDPGLVLPNLG